MRKSANFCRLFLILGAILLLIVAAGCGEMHQNSVEAQENGAEVGKLSMKLSEDMTNENTKNASFVAETYIQSPPLSWVYSLDIQIIDGKVYINDVLYEEASVVPPAIIYSNGFLRGAAFEDERNGNTEIRKLQIHWWQFKMLNPVAFGKLTKVFGLAK